MIDETPEFETLRTCASDEITALLPEGTDADHPLIACVTQLLALSRARIEIEAVEGSLRPTMIVVPTPPAGSIANEILDEIVRLSRSVLISGRYGHLQASKRIDRAGFARFSATMAATPEGLASVKSLSTIISKTLKDLYGRADALIQKHVRTIMRRDLGSEDGHSYVITDTARWAICPHLDGHPLRERTITRRIQALTSYGLVWKTLMKPEATEAIDAGERLSPILCGMLDVDPARLRRITNAIPLGSVLRSTDRSDVVEELVAYRVPAHEWPKDWNDTLWTRTGQKSFLSPAITDGSTEARDALQAFQDDVLRPVMALRAEALGLKKTSRLSWFMQSLTLPDDLKRDVRRRDFHEGMTRAILGTRRRKAFLEGVEIWHRRAACAAALRNEGLSSDPHWPAVCDVWTSPDGRITAVPLTTASELVDEGNAHAHCVGGYYEQCRSGRTHIISMRRDGVPAGTLELKATFDAGRLIMLSPGQFEARYRAKPDDDVRAAAKLFNEQLGDTHPIHSKAVAKHARRMSRDGDYGAMGATALPMSHARRTWPLYRALLPRPFPETVEEWVESSGIGEVLDAALMAVANKKQVEKAEQAAAMSMEDLVRTLSQELGMAA
jgi:hypothetical protein